MGRYEHKPKEHDRQKNASAYGLGQRLIAFRFHPMHLARSNQENDTRHTQTKTHVRLELRVLDSQCLSFLFHVLQLDAPNGMNKDCAKRRQHTYLLENSMRGGV
jgi:hypothetical protein